MALAAGRAVEAEAVYAVKRVRVRVRVGTFKLEPSTQSRRYVGLYGCGGCGAVGLCC